MGHVNRQEGNGDNYSDSDLRYLEPFTFPAAGATVGAGKPAVLPTRRHSRAASTHREAERLDGLEVDNRLERGRLQDRHIGGLCALIFLLA